jgi:hypothetical protein
MMLDQNRRAVSASLWEAAEGITPYDVHVMHNVLESQKKMMNDVLAKNALLVTENSQLRMHLSFMPVEYRDYVSNLQSTNDYEYRNQRRTPRVVIPDTFHKQGSEILLEDAPMAHPSVINMFRDAQYETLSGAKQQMDRGFAMRARITTDAATKVNPKPKSRGNAYIVTRPTHRAPHRLHWTTLCLPQRVAKRANASFRNSQIEDNLPKKCRGTTPLIRQRHPQLGVRQRQHVTQDEFRCHPRTRILFRYTTAGYPASRRVNSGAGRSPLIHREDYNAVNTNGG